MRLANKIVLASMNPDKFNEFTSLLKGYSEQPDIELVPAEFVVRNAQKIGMVETFNTYLENASAKARLVNHASHYPALADDSGIEIAALGGKPGVRSHRFAKLPAGTLSSRVNQDKANNDLLLSELKGKSDRGAKFVCCVTLVIEGILINATGTLEGTIAEAPRGTNGFGYDPLFIPSGSTKTFAEMNDSEKNAVSHRRKAMDSLMLQVQARGIVFAKP